MRRVFFMLMALLCGVNAWVQDVSTAITGQRVNCVEGRAAGFACRNVDLLAFLPDEDLGVVPPYGANDRWGWTDPQTNRAYALVGLADGVAFVDITDPVQPVTLGKLETHTDVSPC